MESADLRLNYSPRIHNDNLTITVKLALIKLASPRTEIISISYDMNSSGNKKDKTKRSTGDESQPLVLFDHDKSMITFMLKNIQLGDSGPYQVRLYTSQVLSQMHNVTVTVLSGKYVAAELHVRVMMQAVAVNDPFLAQVHVLDAGLTTNNIAIILSHFP
jgi:hypothetical protein